VDHFFSVVNSIICGCDGNEEGVEWVWIDEEVRAVLPCMEEGPGRLETTRWLILVPEDAELRLREIWDLPETMLGDGGNVGIIGSG
jgi:hypothetical protein